MMGLYCLLVRRRLDAYQDGELGATVRARTAEHVGRCSACEAELATLGRLRSQLGAVDVPDLTGEAWDGFWPGVQRRLAHAPEPAASRGWLARLGEPLTRHPRLAAGSALAAAGVAAIMLAGPWTETAPPEAPRFATPVTRPTIAPTPAVVARPAVDLGLRAPATPVSHAVVRAVETTDPESSVMVFNRDQPDVTVVWVFGLKRR